MSKLSCNLKQHFMGPKSAIALHQDDLFRQRLDDLIAIYHPLVHLRQRLTGLLSKKNSTAYRFQLTVLQSN